MFLKQEKSEMDDFERKKNLVPKENIFYKDVRLELGQEQTI